MQLATEIEQVHPRIQQSLTHAFTTLPPAIMNRDSAENDLLAMTIEASLVKVSLIRARAQAYLYNYKSPKNPDQDVTGALSAAYEKLKENEREMDGEECKLDRELAEYQLLLNMVDGGSKGFRQIIDDWTRVQRETEECKKDLRRLGWTGDD
ncbi:hypothetical protein B0H10DRAFT_2215325 [Mycena sp. CBHHK59/15]|nr:hypothetical protein B0H10DRAFT_2215325 [Mycena sp. CBHHK59/15]